MLSLNKIMSLWMQRFIPSEFGVDPSKMGHALEPGRVTFDEKMDLRRAIEEANIPHTYFLPIALLVTFAQTYVKCAPCCHPKRKFMYMETAMSKVKHCTVLVRLLRPSFLLYLI